MNAIIATAAIVLMTAAAWAEPDTYGCEPVSLGGPQNYLFGN